MTNDDNNLHDATMTDSDRQEPAVTGSDRQEPAMSPHRSEKHTLTTREAMAMFEKAGVPRNQRTMQRYCKEGDLDCFLDTLEMQYYISPESAEIFIGQLKEIAARHQSIPTHTAPSSAATNDDRQMHDATMTDSDRQEPAKTATTTTDDSVKRGTPEKRDDKHVVGEYEERLAALEVRNKELENQNFNLEIDKRARDQIVGMLRDQMTQQTTVFSAELTQQSRRVGQLETEMRQLMAPERDRRPTRDDRKTVDDDDAIEAEYRDQNSPAALKHNDVSTNAQQP